MKNLLYFLILSILLLSSCRPGRIYQEYHKFDNYTWNRFDKIKFEIPIEEAGTSGDIVMTIRHITQYPYSNLPVNIILNTPGGEERILEKDIRIRDYDGKFRGSGAGDLWDLEEILWPSFYFNETGIYSIELENLIPKVGLAGLIDIGIYVEKTE
ncbi:MAG: gliding motility lipoprotein GldH [Lentimicrobium sp.]|nr:gliding motility lipoprotein GldH [Lentimicrobium sp.]